ncbi:hypothetical protein [Metabacillus arenae]|uniref:Uncharacterized protein n=1 Tax=Metabacillus arenae TaxID=2771434 RepID=A0A926RZK0_9BACI|nr:hypothetical protein [Metabacillus arenae]MBD1379129.1 hypothetical protein [Metabacillus arenae]
MMAAKYHVGEFVKLTHEYLTFKKGEIVVIAEIRNQGNYDYKVNKTNVDSYGYLNEGALEIASDEEILKALKDLREMQKAKAIRQNKKGFNTHVARSVGQYEGNRNVSNVSRSHNNSNNLFETAIQLGSITNFSE